MVELFKKKPVINYEKRAQNFLGTLETPKKSEMIENFKEIHKNIEKVNKDLLGIFKREEDALVNHYKSEMSEAQRNLKQLMDTMNDEELNRKFNAKKDSLEKERGKFLEESLSFSSKCNELKDNLQQILIYSNDIEDELKFLDEQLVYADQHNAKLKSQVDKIKNDILNYDPNYKFLDNEDFWDVFPKGKFKNGTSLLQDSKLANVENNNNAGALVKKSNEAKFFKYQSPYSRRIYAEKEKAPKNASDIVKLERAVAQQKDLNAKLKAYVDDPCFQNSRTEILFNESVEKIKTKILERNTKKPVLPSILSGRVKTTQQSYTQVDTSKIREDSRMSEISTFIGEQELSDIDKRMIIEDFLGNEEVKRQIYDLLFKKTH